MNDTLTIFETLKAADFPDNQATALARAIEAFTAAQAQELETRMNQDLARTVERSDSKFEQLIAKFEQMTVKSDAKFHETNAALEKTMREQTRWITAALFSGIGVILAALGIATGLILHFK